MRILVACEESGAVVTAFKRRWGGAHDIYSCDLLPTSGRHPECHIQADALEIAKMDWDLAICFPPCTNIAVSGARWFEEKKRDGRYWMGMGFFLAFTALDHIPHVCIENPVSAASTFYAKPTQTIHPWQFGHMEEKTTCLWLKNLPPLKPTRDVREQMMQLPKSEREKVHYMPPGPERASLRSKTYDGVARAMAEQWGDESVIRQFEQMELGI
ncbi:MAG: hypothetical protein IKF14_13790 [Atopobiaceae bacterium]|nr:hypothetical protein [Atopobiaceae bacterium]